MGAIIVDDRKVELAAEVVTWHDSGLAFEPGARGVHPRARPCDIGVVHWTGGEGGGEQVYRVLRDRGLSVHFVIDPMGVIYQYIDPALYTAAHAGRRGNNRSVGVEVSCYGHRPEGHRIPEPMRDRYAMTVHSIDTVAGWRVTVADFLPAQHAALGTLAAALGDSMGIERDVLVEPLRKLKSSELRRARGWIGHLHISSNKVDPGSRPLERLWAYLRASTTS